MVQATVPDKSWEGVSAHVFWKWGTSALFYMKIVKLDVVSYLCQTSAKARSRRRKNTSRLVWRVGLFTPIVNSADRILGTKAIFMQ